MTKRIPQSVKHAASTADFFARMPGIHMTAVLHPQEVPSLTRNKVKGMLRKGVIAGGWQSKARHLAKALNRQFDLAAYDANQLSAPPCAKAKKSIAEVLMAQKTAWVLKGTPIHEHTHKVFDELIAGLEAGTYNGHIHPNYIDSGFVEQIHEVFQSLRTETSMRKVEALCAQLDGTAPISLNFGT